MELADGKKRLAVGEKPVEPLTSEEAAILAELHGLSRAEIARKMARERRLSLRGSGWETLPGDQRSKPKALSGNVVGGGWCRRAR